ncbi:putative glucan 1,3-beta-glucosidase A [Senna tora]|uniref:Putative glucan 1,3-beta-glucosidase A n=1 Tax=Senna tora TaxID=362788 RepID=A0A835CHR4_9FABA|nr:putative glucan 1,3-beta-glucosidase A [Senna tora]
MDSSSGDSFLAKTEELVAVDVLEVSGWKDNDPTIFDLTISDTIEGEFQLTNGFGPNKAPQVMKEHWNTFIVEDDFKFIAKNGLNAVRIPVGWWTTRDPTPPPPYVGGSLQILDNAFLWAQKYGLKVILDLHAAPDSQNGVAHSSSRDGTIEWGKTYESIQQTLDVIDFFTARYSKSDSLYAIELLNEPIAPNVTLEALTKYYKAGYEVVRKYSSKVYVILCARLKFTKPDHDLPPPQELLSLASDLVGSVLDVHWYNLFYDIFDNLTVQQNINFIHTNRTSQLDHFSPLNGPLTYVGEWCNEWNVKNATKVDYQRFAKTQLNVYGRATFGWSFWTLKNVQNNWNLEWMINNGYIKL